MFDVLTADMDFRNRLLARSVGAEANPAVLGGLAQRFDFAFHARDFLAWNPIAPAQAAGRVDQFSSPGSVTRITNSR